MIVSAISNSHFLATNETSNKSKSKTKLNDNIADTTFNSLSTPNKVSSEKDLLEIYDAINRWKLFCHNQIEAGNLDILA